MTKRWFGIGWGTRAEPDVSADRAPYQFMVEYWKFYDGYMQRKEHLIEAAITAYSGLAIVLLTRSTVTWQQYGFWLGGLGFAASLLVEQFIYRQFQYWQDGVKFNIASQRLAADWLSRGQVAAEDLKPVPHTSGVRVPRALAAELETIPSAVVPEGFFKRWVTIACCPSGPFARIAYRLMGLWWLAFVARGWLTQTSEWWGLRALWVLLRRVWS
jgi:hypothetical protein